ncbi:actin cytoskeleton-regulatory complex protein sla1 [Pyronema domesticum]|nr:actin cytoskeleton-regulatory complex protein sla1 [Pyronema domesticum]
MSSPFLGVYTAVYSYQAQSDKEISFNEGDLLCVLEKPADDDWWKAKKKGNSVDDDEPVGLIPNNYIEEAKPIGKCKALYDYAQQTEEELSLNEDDQLDIYDNSDPDWTLVGRGGKFGYAPTNYVEKTSGAPSPAKVPSPVPQPVKQVAFQEPEPEPAPVSRPVPRIESPPLSPPLPDRAPPQQYRQPSPRLSMAASPASATFRPESTYDRGDYSRDHHDYDDDHRGERPTRPSRHSTIDHSTSHSHGSHGKHKHDKHDKHDKHHKRSKSPEFDDSGSDSDGPGLPLRLPHGGAAGNQSGIPPGFRTYPVMEVDGRKKRAATLGLGPNRLILLPDKSTRAREEWTMENLTGYNNEGKHVFMDLKHPSKSLDLHAGSTNTAEEIISALAEIRGALKANGLNEVIAAATGAKDNIGTVLYDFPAQGEDEVSVTAGDEVIILDAGNDEWWLVQRRVNGEEGVIPSSYVERGRKNVPTGGIKESPGIRAGGNDNRKSFLPSPTHTTTQSSSYAASGHSSHSSHSNHHNDVGASKVPERRSSLAPTRREPAAPTTKSKPDLNQVRTWTDRSGTFKVEAQFLGCTNGKLHLHKVNGVKIAVPVNKMSMTDLRYVEDKTGMSLDEEKPLSEILREQRKNAPPPTQDHHRAAPPPPSARSPQPHSNVGASVVSVQQSGRKIDYDWFGFFLECGVEVNNCQRYALNFAKDELDETSLEGIGPDTMRTLGMKEGDILRVSKKLDERFGRNRKIIPMGDGTSLFTDENGNLKSSRARPPPAVQTGAVDPKALQTQTEGSKPPTPAPRSPARSPVPEAASGFDDDAWAPKPTKTPSPAPPPVVQAPPPAPAPAPAPPKPTGALGELASLSLDTPPLQPTIQNPQFVPPADPIFSGSNLTPQPTGRARPPAPQITGTSSLGIAPPPPRPLSAPQNYLPQQQQPMVPQFTGYSTMAPMQPPIMTAPMMPPPPQIMYQPTGFAPNGFGQPGMMQPQMTGMSGMGMSGMGMQPQMTGMSGMQQMQPQMTGMQSMQPQMTGMQFGGFGNNGMAVNRGLPPPLVPQMTAAPLMPQRTAAPTLIPQPTGPAPTVRFGVQKLTPQPTGKANLNKATPDNPFGFD